jgi:hypothetical protein
MNLRILGKEDPMISYFLLHVEVLVQDNLFVTPFSPPEFKHTGTAIRKGWSRNNILDLCSGISCFESRSGLYVSRFLTVLLSSFGQIQAQNLY